MRMLATLVIVLLFALDVLLPRIPIARRGNERVVREHVPELAARVGEKLPDLAFEDLDGRPVHLSDLRGHPLLLVFERSVDW
jgi:cytochrome oxidase Cu insertion factor (SCO1/SenC/PrrC family)